MRGDAHFAGMLSWPCHENICLLTRLSECYLRYIRSKPIKRIESYRIKNDQNDDPPRVLLPVSGGVSSVVLLQILDWHLRRQLEKRGKSSFLLHILMVTMPMNGLQDTPEVPLREVMTRFPGYSYSFHTLSDVFDIDNGIFEDYLGLDLEKLPEAGHTLDRFLSRASTASARTDLLHLLLMRLIAAIARTKECTTVIWGHSDTRLAAQTMSNVAKGRGGSSVYDLADGHSPWGLTFYHPMRDLFKSELFVYANSPSDSLSSLIIPDTPHTTVSTSIRSMSMDDLLSHYINSQGEKYPSIMANVVRTSSKLQAPHVPTDSTLLICPICHSPSGEASALDDKVIRRRMCYGCERLKSELRF